MQDGLHLPLPPWQGKPGEPFRCDAIAHNIRRLSGRDLHLQGNQSFSPGSNVLMMQGDATRIVSMGDRERREIIDELAGVALFDQRIEECCGKLTAVGDHEERCHIVES